MILLVARNEELKDNDYPELIDIYDETIISLAIERKNKLNEINPKNKTKYKIIQNVTHIIYEDENDIYYRTSEDNEEYILKSIGYIDKVLNKDIENNTNIINKTTQIILEKEAKTICNEIFEMDCFLKSEQINLYQLKITSRYHKGYLLCHNCGVDWYDENDDLINEYHFNILNHETCSFLKKYFEYVTKNELITF